MGVASRFGIRSLFATFRAEPKRFAIGLSIVFFGGALAGAMLMRQSIQLALGVQFGL